MKKIVRFLILFAIVSLSCSSVTNLFDNLAESDGPILGLNVAATLDEQGQLVDPTFTFSPDQPQITVVAYIGEPTSSSLEIAWYRLPDEGEPEPLFTHTVEVAAGDLAYSVGQNPGALAPGTYKAVATLGDQSEGIEFDVASEPTDGGTITNTAETAGTQSPTAGGSGTRRPASGGSNGSGLWVGNLYGDIDAATDSVADIVEIVSTIEMPSAKVEVKACIKNQACKIVGRYETPKSSAIGSGGFKINPCNLPGGSDLPGTELSVTAQMVKGGTEKDVAKITLGDDSLAPRVEVVAELNGVELTQKEFQSGMRVEPGDKIKLTVTAEETPSGGPWQTGIEYIQVFANGKHLNEEGQGDYTALRHKTCKEKSMKQAEKFTYRVPKKNPPAEITLCAMAEDFVGNVSNDEDDCGTFYTGEVWEGIFRAQGGDARCFQAFEGPVQLVVARDGVVTGTGRIQLKEQRMDPIHCLLITTPFDVEASGTKDEGGFHLTLIESRGGSVLVIDVPVQGQRGENTIQTALGSSVTIKLECKTCGPEPVSLLQHQSFAGVKETASTGTGYTWNKWEPHSFCANASS